MMVFGNIRLKVKGFQIDSIWRLGRLRIMILYVVDSNEAVKFQYRAKAALTQFSIKRNRKLYDNYLTTRIRGRSTRSLQDVYLMRDTYINSSLLHQKILRAVIVVEDDQQGRFYQFIITKYQVNLNEDFRIISVKYVVSVVQTLHTVQQLQTGYKI